MDDFVPIQFLSSETDLSVIHYIPTEPGWYWANYGGSPIQPYKVEYSTVHGIETPYLIVLLPGITGEATLSKFRWYGKCVFPIKNRT
jgi:hypothetical protein